MDKVEPTLFRRIFKILMFVLSVLFRINTDENVYPSFCRRLGLFGFANKLLVVLSWFRDRM